MQIIWTYGTVSQDVQQTAGGVLNWSSVAVAAIPTLDGPWFAVESLVGMGGTNDSLIGAGGAGDSVFGAGGAAQSTVIGSN